MQEHRSDSASCRSGSASCRSGSRRVEMADSPCRDGRLTVSRWPTHRVEMADSPWPGGRVARAGSVTDRAHARAADPGVPARRADRGRRHVPAGRAGAAAGAQARCCGLAAGARRARRPHPALGRARDARRRARGRRDGLPAPRAAAGVRHQFGRGARRHAGRGAARRRRRARRSLRSRCTHQVRRPDHRGRRPDHLRRAVVDVLDTVRRRGQRHLRLGALPRLRPGHAADACCSPWCW